MVRPMLRQTVELARQSLDRAQLSSEQLSAVLLVGGSSRIPLVSELVGSALGAPVRVDRAVPPNRMKSCVKARSVVEANAGTADAFLAAGL